MNFKMSLSFNVDKSVLNSLLVLSIFLAKVLLGV